MSSSSLDDLDARIGLVNNHDDSYFSDIEEKAPRPLHERVSVWRKWWAPIVTHTLILFIWISVAIYVKKMALKSHTKVYLQSYSPAQLVLEPELQVFDSSGRPDSPFAGKPSEEQDEAWSNLLQYSNVRFHEDELDSIDPARRDQAISLPDGGYFGTLHVIHELHCIKHLHRFLYSEYYFPHLSTSELEDRRLHLEHCLDTLRQGIMCRGDVSPITMRWGHTQAIPLANFSSPHSCVNWDAINDWSKSRTIDRLFEPGYLMHPTLGVVYKEDFDNKIGIVHDD